MEETLFEYRYQEDDEFSKEEISFMYFRTRSRMVNIAIRVLIIGFLIFYAIRWTRDDYPVPALIWAIAAVYSALLIFTLFYDYKRSIKMARKRRTELYGNDPVFIEMSVTDTKIKAANTASHQEVTCAVDSISKLRETKNLIVLISKARLLYIFSKNGFTKGTPEEFVEFMRSRGCK